jgi:hypothetical protein
MALNEASDNWADASPLTPCYRCKGPGSDTDLGLMCKDHYMAAEDNERQERSAEADAFDRTAPSKRLARFGHMGVGRYGSRHD